MTPSFIAKQLAQPSGVLGRFVAHMMNRRNARMNLFAVRQLEVSATDRVLEIGFGGGVSLPLLLNEAGFVTGVDRSRDAVLWAQSNFSTAVATGKAAFHEGNVEAMPFEDFSFEKVCTVNTVYFWKSLTAAFTEIHRVLVPGGRLVVGFLPKEWMDRMGMPPDIFAARSPDEVLEALQHTGFENIRVERPEVTTAWNAIVASR